MPSARSRSVVGQKHAPAPLPPSCDVGLGQVGRVHGGGPRPEHAFRGEQAGRGEPVAAEARGVLGGLLREVHVQGAALGGLRDDGERVAGHRPHRVHGHPVGARGPFGPGVDVAVAEAQLGAFQRGVEAAREVAGVEQGEADARVGRGGAQGGPHGVRFGVRHAAGAVVDVVELGDGRDPGQRHLGVRGGGQGPVGVGVEAGGDGVHRLPPGPERAATAVRAPAQRPVERVAVRVGEPGQHHAGQPPGVAGRCARLDVGEPAVGDLERDVGRETVGEVGGRGPVAGHRPTPAAARPPTAAAGDAVIAAPRRLSGTGAADRRAGKPVIGPPPPARAARP